MSVLWIRIGFKADPDPAFYLNVNVDSDPGNKTKWIYADPDPGQIFKVTKVNFY
jgi:hypothetical protein